jgi:hypothetical protein
VRTLFSSEDTLRKNFQGNRYESALAAKPVNYLQEWATGLAFPSDGAGQTLGASVPDLGRIMNRSKGVENFLVMPTEH